MPLGHVWAVYRQDDAPGGEADDPVQELQPGAPVPEDQPLSTHSTHPSPALLEYPAGHNEHVMAPKFE